MDKAIQKRLLLVALKVIRDLAMSAYEEHAGHAPEPVYKAVMKLVEDCLEAEVEVLRWDTTKE
jgi:hypothetical protein